jgi:hypothetical protein
MFSFFMTKRKNWGNDERKKHSQKMHTSAVRKLARPGWAFLQF